MLHILSILYMVLFTNIICDVSVSNNVNIREEFSDIPGEHLFRKLFRQRRAEQLEAVKGLVVIGSYEKQFKMVSVILDKVFSVLQNSRVLLESSGYAPGISSFPTDETVLDALSNILENTALFGDIVLHLPEISQKVLASNYEWHVLFQWSIGFANQTQLLDKQTSKLLQLVNMELNVTERDSDYENPYRTKDLHQTALEYKEPSPRKKKTVKKRGPRLSTGEL